MEQVETITVKGMVCCRCVLTIKQAFNQHGLQLKAIELGKLTVIVDGGYSYSLLCNILLSLGFEILVDKPTKTVEDIKSTVERYLASEKELRFSELVSRQLGMNYDQLSSVFSSREGITLEQYLIRKKIERVKHMLATTLFTLTDISYRNKYNSVHHLSRQFKEITGSNPTEYRKNNPPENYIN
jgi:AraC family transcriptional regulator